MRKPSQFPCTAKKLKQCALLVFLGIVSLNFSSAHAHQDTFKHKVIHSGSTQNETKISHHVDDQEVGFITITKTPLFSFYILHTLYVHPQYRHQGYGKRLLKYTCEHATSLGASRMYIQPGPFELDDNGYLIKPTDVYDERVQALIALYTKCGFTPASKPLTYCAYALYKCMGIEENAKYLMVKT